MKRLQDAGREFRPDLIHSHNLPDSLTAIALELFAGRVPVVHDIHDLQSLRRTPSEHGFPEPREPLALEQLAVEESSALVAVSKELLEVVRTRYRPTAPTLVEWDDKVPPLERLIESGVIADHAHIGEVTIENIAQGDHGLVQYGGLEP